MSDHKSQEWNFQVNMAGLTLLLFATGYIGQHLTQLMPPSGVSRVLVHYLGELVLTVVALGLALWRAFGASQLHQGRVAWLRGAAVCFYVGLAAVALNVAMLAVLLVLDLLGGR